MKKPKLLSPIVFAFLFFISSGVSSGQDPTQGGGDGGVRGTIVDVETGVLLEGVHITITGSQNGTVTNKFGEFLLDPVSEGEMSLTISALGYKVQQVTVQVAAARTSHIRIELDIAVIPIPEVMVEHENMIGGSVGLDNMPGSAHRITLRSIQKHQYSDAGRLLRSIPGINVQEEDGYGLRPNIGIRGTGSERSARISLMEDGVLTAPAPYTAPSAYYFPSIGRMQEIEVRKGSSQIAYGPYTTGGAINFLSTAIPDGTSIKLKAAGGSEEHFTGHLQAGSSFENVAFLVELYENRSDGFKHIDSGGSTGFEKLDIMAKLRFNSGKDASIQQALLFKMLFSDEVSDETYLGLTSSDFDVDPLRRYRGSSQDQMNAEYLQFSARHSINLSSSSSLTTTAYRSRFDRNWYKLDNVVIGEEKKSISTILSNPHLNARAYDVIAWDASAAGEVLNVKANNREYLSTGIQSKYKRSDDFDAFSHSLELGFRLHYDEMDRFQWVDGYRALENALELALPGIPGTDSNRIESASSSAVFIQDKVEMGDWSFHPGIRYESIELAREDYGKADPERTGASISRRSNDVNVWIPGFSMSRKTSENLLLFAGIHKGFSPPGSKEGTDPERSRNVEFGLRSSHHKLSGEVVVFHNAYQNLLGSDLAATGGSGSGDLFNGGSATVKGLESSARFNFGPVVNWAVSLPIRLSYTYTDAGFNSSFESDFGAWKTVQDGDDIPYISRHLFTFETGVEGNRFDVHASGTYVGSMRTVAGSGTPESSHRIDSHLVLDLGSSVRISPQIKVFTSIKNVGNLKYVAARRPAGLRPGLPRTLVIGTSVSL